MKKLILSLAILLASTAPALALETPTWRTSATAIGKTPSLSLAVQPGDIVMVFVTSNGHSSSDFSGGSVSDNGGTGGYWDYSGDVWKQASGKWGGTHMYMKGSQIASATTLTISASIPGASTCLMAAVAVSGLSLVALDPDVTGSGTHTIRQQKNNGQDAISPDAPIMPGNTPSVPTFAQTTAYLSTSLLFAVFANESDPNGTSAPSGWTRQVGISTTVAGKHISMVIESTTGVTNYLTTWGSTTATRGNACAFEVQPLQ